MTYVFRFELDGWEGTEDIYGYDMWVYLDDAWKVSGRSGERPETFATEAEARKIVEAIRPDDDGVFPRVKVVAVED